MPTPRFGRPPRATDSEIYGNLLMQHSHDTPPFSENKSPDFQFPGDSFGSAAKELPALRGAAAAITNIEALPALRLRYEIQRTKHMTAVAVNRGGGRPSKGLRKFIGFRTRTTTADGIAKVAAAKGLTVSEYVLSAVEPQLQSDLAALDQYEYQQELPIRIAS